MELRSSETAMHDVHSAESGGLASAKWVVRKWAGGNIFLTLFLTKQNGSKQGISEGNVRK